MKEMKEQREFKKSMRQFCMEYGYVHSLKPVGEFWECVGSYANHYGKYKYRRCGLYKRLVTLKRLHGDNYQKYRL